MDNEMEARRIRANQAEEGKAMDRREANINARRVLEEQVPQSGLKCLVCVEDRLRATFVRCAQIAEQEQSKALAYNEFLKEKAMVPSRPLRHCRPSVL
jgi:hypothetical protein